MPSPRENPALWDFVVIGPITLPPDGVNGYAKVEASIEWDNDPKKAKGAKSTRTTSQGPKESPPVKIEVTFQDAVTGTGESQYDLVVAALDKIASSPGPYGIAHGQTDFARVRDIMIDKITGPKWAGGRGTITIEAKKWESPAKATGGAGGAGVPAALLAELAKAEADLAAYKKQNIQSADVLRALEARVAWAKSKVAASKTATKTPDKSAPTKDYYQVGKDSKPTVPTGEIQP